MARAYQFVVSGTFIPSNVPNYCLELQASLIFRNDLLGRVNLFVVKGSYRIYFVLLSHFLMVTTCHYCITQKTDRFSSGKVGLWGLCWHQFGAYA